MLMFAWCKTLPYAQYTLYIISYILWPYDLEMHVRTVCCGMTVCAILREERLILIGSLLLEMHPLPLFCSVE